MHILILTDRFTPEIGAPSTRTHAHAKVWVEMGHRVTVVTCAPNSPRGEVFPGYRNSWYQEEELDGFRVVRLWSYMAANEGVVRRSLDYASFPVSVMLQNRRLPKADVILATSPPILVPAAGHLLSRRREIPWVFEVRDLWPASIRAVGVRMGPMLKLLESMELGLYRSADRVIVVTEGFRDDLVGRGVPGDKIDLVTNGTDIAPAVAGARMLERKAFGIADDEFVVGFVGTLGMAQGASILVRAAAQLKEHPGIRILVVGEGAERAGMEAQARSQGLSNIAFHDFVPHERVAAVLAAIDLPTVLLKRDATFETVIPSKIFEIFAAGRPLLAAVSGEARRVIEKAGGGVCVDPEDETAFAAAVLSLCTDAPRLRAMGDSGAQTVRQFYSRTAKAKLALESLLRAAQ